MKIYIAIAAFDHDIFYVGPDLEAAKRSVEAKHDEWRKTKWREDEEGREWEHETPGTYPRRSWDNGLTDDYTLCLPEGDVIGRVYGYEVEGVTCQQ